ncbi:ABC-type antimicrobial peptide transport system permease subunit [Lachnospiraceae bacterium PM6-15]|uniref:FtsX-like permease family protein n=1 Tax=Ohessyouella blattaphilus TaxID=2949333 RepID=UPI003E22B233
MKKTGYLSIAPGAVPSRKGNALLFEDSTFIKTATNLEDNIRLFKIFLPVLLGALLVVIYLLVNMLMQSRREEYLLYRVMGMRRRSVGVLFCLEHILIALGGVIVSLILSMIMGGKSWMQGVVLSLLVLLCIFVGTMIALVSIGRKSLMLAVQKND